MATDGHEPGSASADIPKPPDPERLVTWRIAATIAGLLVAAALGVLLVYRFVETERARELHDWQIRIGIVADSRASEVDAWLRRQSDEMRALAENVTVQLFMTELDVAGGDLGQVADAEAQLAYVHNLLVVTADRTGFAGPVLGPQVPANVPRAAVGGLALVDRGGRLLEATEDFAPPALPEDPGLLARGGLLPLRLDAAGAPSLAVVAPVHPLQAEPRPGAELGYVIGVKPVAPELYSLLENSGTLARSLEVLLVRPSGVTIDYLSPLADGTAPLGLSLDADTADLAASFALRSPGGFGLRKDYRGIEVLATGRALPAADWALLVKVDRAEALAESESRLARLMAVLLLVIALVGVAMAGLWRHGASRRAARAARLYRETAEILGHQRNLLRLVTDSQPTGIFILDDGGRYRFANRVAAADAGIAAEDMIGKQIAAVLGPASAERYLALNRRAKETGWARSGLVRADGEAGARVLSSEHIPVDPTPELPSSVLVVERDVTVEITERERRERTLDHLVEALVGVVDRRDPFAAEHSERVGRLTHLLAVEIGLDETQREAARLAGRLMNFGKILVPAAVLSSSDRLSEEELARVREGIAATADLLADVEFDGPVVETLRQSQEHVDGSGHPRGLSGEEILITARLVAVANGFVGMISARAHREALSIDQATAALMSGAASVYDQSVVAALVNYLDNRGGRAEWQ